MPEKSWIIRLGTEVVSESNVVIVWSVAVRGVDVWLRLEAVVGASPVVN